MKRRGMGDGEWSCVLPLVVTVALLGCGGRTADPGALRGTVLARPVPKPDFTLVTTAGEPFDFRRDTADRVALLFFGFTNCPDVCPVHLANLAAVLPTLAPGVAHRITVVFVTTDPERDTPTRVREWLDAFDPRYVGLVGAIDSVNRIQREIGLAPAVRLGDGPDYQVAHAAQVVAFTADDRAHVVYPFGTRQADWAHDLPRLVRMGAR